MRGIVMPEPAEDFTADPVELFFDLGYVLAFSQLVSILVRQPDWAHVGRVTLLFLLMWLPWSEFTWSANAVSGNGRTVRVIFLLGTAVNVPMAASVSTAFEGGGPVFAVCLTVIYLLALALMALGLSKEQALKRAVWEFLGLSTLGMVLIVAGGFASGDARIGCWLVGLVVIVFTMARAGSGAWVIRAGHFAERHGLIVIIALGEVVVAIGVPVVDALEQGDGLTGLTVVALVASGLLGGLLWWSYFDRPARALELRAEMLEEATARGRFARDVYTWAHAPIVLGIILAAAGLEEIALKPSDPVDTAFGLMLVGGLALTMLGLGGAVVRAFRLFPPERPAALVAIAAVVFLGRAAPGAWVLVLVVLLLGIALAFEHRRVEGGPRFVIDE